MLGLIHCLFIYQVLARQVLAFLATVPLVRERTWTRCRFACCPSYGRKDFPGECKHSEVCTLSVDGGRRLCHCERCVRKDAQPRLLPSRRPPSLRLSPPVPLPK